MGTRTDTVLSSLLPGAVFERAIRKERFGNSVFGHSHEVSAITRAKHEDEVLQRMRERFPGGIVVIGCSRRELKKLLPHDHACGTLLTAHDAAHQASACDYRLCAVKRDTVYSCDYLYYQDAEDIAQLISQHDAVRYVANICAPFYGGCGKLYGGEGHWKAVGGGQVRVVSDNNTNEQWEHPDMLWLVNGCARKLADGRWLTWTPFLVGGDRATYVFQIVETEPKDVGGAMPTLGDWVSGVSEPPEKFHGRDVAYTARQVAEALRLATHGVPDTPVRVSDVMTIQRWLETNPQMSSDWRRIAAQKARSTGAADVTTTVELALYLAKRKQRWLEMSSRRPFTTEGIMRMKDTAHLYWDIFKVPIAIGAAAAAGYALSRRPHVAAVGLAACGFYCLTRGEKPAEKRIDYAAHSIMENCKPFVGELTTPLGSLVSDDCVCEPKAAYGLAGIAVLPGYLTTACGCPKTLATAFKRRVLEVPMPVVEREVDGEVREVELTLDNIRVNCLIACAALRRVTGISSGVVESMAPTFKEWSERDNFTRKARDELRQSRNVGVTSESGRANAFVKKEIVLKPGECGTDADDYKPRAIQPIEYATRAQIGPLIYGVTHAIKFVFSPDSSVWFASGATGEDVGAWFDAAVRRIDGHAAFVIADYGNFDGTNRLDGGQMIAAGVKALVGFPFDAARADFALRRSRTVGFGGRARYGGADVVLKQTSPSVSSGHDDTTCGNSSCNAVVHGLTMAVVYGKTEARRVAEYTPPEGWVEPKYYGPSKRDAACEDAYRAAFMEKVTGTNPRECYLANELGKHGGVDQSVYPSSAVVMGDDGLAVSPAKDAEAYLEAFVKVSKNLGYIPEARISHDPTDVEFCSMLMWPSTDGTVAGPKIGRIMTRTGFKRMGDKSNWLAQVRGDALGLASSVNHIPILRALVPRLLALSGSRSISDPSQRYKFYAARAHDICDETWDFASDRYGLSRSVLEELELQVASVKRLPAILHHPAWDTIVRRDA